MKLNYAKYAEINGMTPEDFKQEVMITCGAIMSKEMDDTPDSDAMRFTFSDSISTIELTCRRIKE